MGVIESIGFALRCDFPGCSVATEDIGDYSSWAALSSAAEEWRDCGGYLGPEGSYCSTHTIATEDDDTDPGLAPLLYSLDALFLLAERRIAARIEHSARLARYRHERRCDEWARRDARAERNSRLLYGLFAA